MGISGKCISTLEINYTFEINEYFSKYHIHNILTPCEIRDTLAVGGTHPTAIIFWEGKDDEHTTAKVERRLNNKGNVAVTIPLTRAI